MTSNKYKSTLDFIGGFYKAVSLMFFFGSIGPLCSKNAKMEGLAFLLFSIPGMVYWAVRYYKLIRQTEAANKNHQP